MSEEFIEKLAQIIAYEMGDTMGDSRAVFWSSYSYKKQARVAAEKCIQAYNDLWKSGQ